MLPPLPDWNAAHPVVVHLPLGVLAIVPIFLILALLTMRRTMAYAITATLLLVIGAGAAWLAVASGEAAADLVAADHPGYWLVHEHEELAELARTLFLVLAGVLVVGLAVSAAVKPAARGKVRLILVAVVLIGHLASLVVLANAAHMGGQLVHHYRITAPIEAPEEPADAEADHQHDARGQPDATGAGAAEEAESGAGEHGD